MMITNTSINKIFLLVNFNVSAMVSHETMMLQEISQSESKFYFIVLFFKCLGETTEPAHPRHFGDCGQKKSQCGPSALKGYYEMSAVHNEGKNLLMGLDFC